MLTVRHQIRFAQAVIYVGLIHTAAIIERPFLAASAIAVFCGMSIASNLCYKRSGRGLIGWSVAFIAACALAWGTRNGLEEASSIVLAPPVLINVYFFFLFGKTLLPGRVPLITHFSRINLKGSIPYPLAGYTRLLTILWTGLFAVMAIESAALAAFAGLELWSWMVNIVNPGIAVAFFILEHFYRVYRYHRFGPFSLVRALNIMMRPESWVQSNVEPSQ